MQIDSNQIAARLDALLADIEPHIEADLDGGSDWYRGSDANTSEARMRAQAALERYAPPGSVYRRHAENLAESQAFDGWVVVQLVGPLKALRADYRDGELQTVQQIVQGSVLADFAEMAEELLRADYKDAAAVISGGVLEQHLRLLATNRGIEVRKGDRYVKADRLNADLAKADAYGTLDQKQVTAWLGLRNHAAHAEYDEYSADQVVSMLAGVQAFVSRVPA